MEQQIASLLNVICLLIAAVLGLCCYIAFAPPWEWKGWRVDAKTGYCPLHRTTPDKCAPYHEDD